MNAQQFSNGRRPPRWEGPTRDDRIAASMGLGEALRGVYGNGVNEANGPFGDLLAKLR